jgi:ATP-dependent helicase Lhr and Lhr-like helicase
MTKRINLSLSNSESGAFQRLHPLVRKWIWDQGWKQLRPVQEQSIPIILEGERNVLIMAPTAGGKTEAAFLPICSKLAETGSAGGIRVLNISPLKALINDQFDRLEPLCEVTGIPLTRWHGDAPQAARNRLLENPAGILQITPESLEALFVNHGMAIRSLFGKLDYVVIDELHAFLGGVRGRQLQSLLGRVENAISRRIPRIALSATIGDIDMARGFLRRSDPERVEVISATDDGTEIRLLLKGYRIENEVPANPGDEEEALDQSYRDICDNLFRTLRGSTNLIFANSRREVELISSRLIDLSEQHRVPNEFFPHHGSLSADRRNDAEEQLKDLSIPTTAIATSTLELGIDIGKVASIAQIGAPPSVASMRQRIGRSGRRDGIASMRLYVRESKLRGNDRLLVRLHPHLIRAIAMTNLMIAKWFEPMPGGVFDFSTLVQQTLSMICERGGARANVLWDALCRKGAFPNLDQSLYGAFLCSLAGKKLIEQAPSGEILLGENGERLTTDYRFYAAFQVAEEYRLVANGKTIGHLPIIHPLVPESFIVFAGRYWQIESVDERKREVFLQSCRGGRVPIFGGDVGLVHARIRQEAKKIYQDNEMPIYLDHTARELLSEARSAFHNSGLDRDFIVQDENQVLVFTWDGDTVANTLSLQMMLDGHKNFTRDGVLIVEKAKAAAIAAYLSELSSRGLAREESLVSIVSNLHLEKHDEYISDDLLALDYARKMLDREGAGKWVRQAWG